MALLTDHKELERRKFSVASQQVSINTLPFSLTTRVDEVSPSITYVGKATPGTTTSTSEWQITRITDSGTSQVIEFANSSPTFTNVWDDRASLNYG